MIRYNPADWYWQVTGAGVYGSARRGLVSTPTSDAPYLAWRGAPTGDRWTGNGPGSVAPDTASLDAVLVAAGLPSSGLTPPSAAQLIAYAGGKVSTLRNIPRSYDLSGVSVFADATSDTVALVAGLGGWGTDNPTARQGWIDDFGTATQITGAQAVTLMTSGRAYIQALYAILGSACVGIANATITTTAQVDALAWPT